MPNSENGIFLAFDFGARHIGIATGQKVTKTATPVGSISAKEGQPNWQQLDAIIAKWQPIALIVGHPLNMDGTYQPLTHRAEAFADQLKARYHLPIHLVDERLSTKAARETLFNQGGYKALKKDQVDAVSAQIILESWLQQNTSDPSK